MNLCPRRATRSSGWAVRWDWVDQDEIQVIKTNDTYEIVQKLGKNNANFLFVYLLGWLDKYKLVANERASRSGGAKATDWLWVQSDRIRSRRAKN